MFYQKKNKNIFSVSVFWGNMPSMECCFGLKLNQDANGNIVYISHGGIRVSWK